MTLGSNNQSTIFSSHRVIKNSTKKYEVLEPIVWQYKKHDPYGRSRRTFIKAAELAICFSLDLTKLNVLSETKWKNSIEKKH